MIRKIYMLNDFLKEKFNEKIYKVSLDGGFTCPNRDGKVSKGGCIFCSENGSGDFTATKLKSIHEQIEEQIDLVSKKYIKFLLMEVLLVQIEMGKFPREVVYFVVKMAVVISLPQN